MFPSNINIKKAIKLRNGIFRKTRLTKLSKYGAMSKQSPRDRTTDRCIVGIVVNYAYLNLFNIEIIILEHY